MSNAATIETRGLRVYPAAQSETAVAHFDGGPRYGLNVAVREYAGPDAGRWVRWADGAGWREARAVALTDADLAALASAPRHYLCG